MGCYGPCASTELQYGATTVDYVEPLSGSAPAIDKTNAEAKSALDAVAQSQSTRATSGCEDGCDCIENKFQPNVPRDKPQTSANVPWEEDDVRVQAPLKRGNFSYRVHGSVHVRQRTLAGHCRPQLITEDVPAKATTYTLTLPEFAPKGSVGGYLVYPVYPQVQPAPTEKPR